MQKRIVLTALAVIFAGISVAQNEHPKALEQTILDLEHRWINAATAADAKTASQLLTDSYVYVWSDGSVHERNEYLADVGKTTWQVNEISETRVIPYGQTVIVLGKWRGKGKDSSGSQSTAFNVTPTFGLNLRTETGGALCHKRVRFQNESTDRDGSP